MNPGALIQKLMAKVKGTPAQPGGEAGHATPEVVAGGKSKTKLIVALAVVALAGGGGLVTSLVSMKKGSKHAKADSHGKHDGKHAGHGGGHGDHEGDDADEHDEEEGSEHADADDHGDAEHDEHGDGHDVADASDHGSAHGKDSEHEKDAEHGSDHKSGHHGDVAHNESHDSGDEHELNEDEDEHAERHPASHSDHASKGHHGKSDPTFVQTYKAAFESVQSKVHELQVMDEEVRRLRLENSNLRLRNESLQFDCRASDAISDTQRIEIKLGKETGAKVGRTLASIQYRPPSNMLPSQLHTLAATYFKGHEDEKAAVIMTFLTGLEDSDLFKDPKNYLMTGVAWFRLDNFELADFYFGKVLEKEPTAGTLQYQAQARLWRALAAQRTNKHTKSQFWLTELVDNHPKSLEAGWVNQVKEGKRAPSSTQSKPHEASSGHH